jgi:hypothetical protein
VEPFGLGPMDFVVLIPIMLVFLIPLALAAVFFYVAKNVNKLWNALWYTFAALVVLFPVLSILLAVVGVMAGEVSSGTTEPPYRLAP